MKNKKLALISTYCNNDEKLDALRNTIQEYKKLDVDIFVYSPIKLPQDIEIGCKFLFYTDENPILTFPTRGHVHWKDYRLKNSNKLKFLVMSPDYGWASNYQLKKLINLGSTYDYDIYYLTIYDLEFDSNVKSIIRNNIINIINPNTRGFTHTLHFTPFDRDTMIKAEKFFDYLKYINNPNRVAEHVAVQWVEDLGMKLQKTPVTDTIMNNNDLFNLSTNERYKFFTNNDGGDVKLVFTEIKDDIKLKINDYIIDSELKIDYLYNTNIKLNDLKNFTIYNDSYTDEYIDVIKQQNEKYTIEEL